MKSVWTLEWDLSFHGGVLCDEESDLGLAQLDFVHQLERVIADLMKYYCQSRPQRWSIFSST